MKNNKRSPLTIARQAAFCADLGILPGQTLKNALAGELGALAVLSHELIGQEKMTVPRITMPNGEPLAFDKPQARIAMEATAQGYRENTPELYGRKTSEVDFGCGYRVHPVNGPSADCELEETDRALLATASHAGTNTNDNDDKPETESL